LRLHVPGEEISHLQPWVEAAGVVKGRSANEHGSSAKTRDDLEDSTARKEITIRAPGSGRFVKELYYHSGVPRWQVNCQIFVGDYAIECLFEPGNQVPEAEARRQFDLLIPNREVKAGDVLGALIIAPGNEYSIFHWGVCNTKTGLTECPLLYATPLVRDALLAIIQRDLPGTQICFDQYF